jgi:hypothetical protein
MVLVALAAWFASIPLGTVARAAAGQPTACSAFTMDLRRELSLMRSPSGMAVTAAARADSAPAIPADRLLIVKLVRQGTVTFSQPPDSKRGGPDSYAGLVSLGPLSTGEWRVSANRAVWFDVVSSNRLLQSPTFEMQAGCADLRKSVVFVQPNTAPAWLQVSGGAEPEVRIVVTAHALAQ